MSAGIDWPEVPGTVEALRAEVEWLRRCFDKATDLGRASEAGARDYARGYLDGLLGRAPDFRGGMAEVIEKGATA